MQITDVYFDFDHTMVTYDEMSFLEYCRANGCNVNIRTFRRTHSFMRSISRQGIERNNPQFLDDLFAEFLEQEEIEQWAVPGAHDALQKLSRHFRLHMVTARGKKLSQATQEVRQRFFHGIEFHSSHFDLHTRKGSVLKGRNGCALVDDSAEELTHAAQEAPDARMFHFPSFRGQGRSDGSPRVDHPNVTRLEGCDQVQHAERPQDKTPIWERAWEEIVRHLVPLAAPAYAH